MAGGEERSAPAGEDDVARQAVVRLRRFSQERETVRAPMADWDDDKDDDSTREAINSRKSRHGLPLVERDRMERDCELLR